MKTIKLNGFIIQLFFIKFTVMKKLILLSAAALFFSCDKDKAEGCNCDGVFTTLNGYPNTFTIQNVKINCETGQLEQEVQPQYIFLNCK